MAPGQVCDAHISPYWTLYANQLFPWNWGLHAAAPLLGKAWTSHSTHVMSLRGLHRVTNVTPPPWKLASTQPWEATQCIPFP
jgi:hypothetical protein